MASHFFVEMKMGLLTSLTSVASFLLPALSGEMNGIFGGRPWGVIKHWGSIVLQMACDELSDVLKFSPFSRFAEVKLFDYSSCRILILMESVSTFFNHVVQTYHE